MNLELTRWWVLDRTIWTAATLLIAYGVGAFINRIIVNRLHKAASRTTGDWDDAIIVELRRRTLLWSGLIGIWLSIGYWPLDEQWSARLTGLTAAIAILSVTTAAASIVVRLVTIVGPRVNPEMQVSGLLRNVVRLVIFTVGLLVLLQTIGIEITPVLAALGVGGLAVALALQEPLSNLFAGLFITVAGQIRIGDYVKVEPGPEGVVADFSWNATQIRSPAGNVVIVPNAKLTQAIVTNFDRPTRDTGFGVEFTVGHGSNLEQVERTALDVARTVMRETEGGVPTAEPTVRFVGFVDPGIRVAVFVRSRQFTDHLLVRHEIVKRLNSALPAAGVTIVSVPPQPPPKAVPDR